MRFLAFPALLAVCATRTFAAELQVGPGQVYAEPEAALKAAVAGDVIVIHARPQGYGKVALNVTKPKITIRAAEGSGRVRLDGEGFDYSGRGAVPRAIVQFSPGADSSVIEGFELSSAHNESGNGAGVRINQANDVIVRNCDIHDCDMGMMSNGNGTDATAKNQRIEDCVIHSNGTKVNAGYNHNLYLGGTSVTLLRCEIYGSLTGHNLKSRAHQIEVRACYIHDSANRELDLVDAKGDTDRPGSDGLIVDCRIVKSPTCPGNHGVIHFGRDGKATRDGTLTIRDCEIVTPFGTPVITLDTPQTNAVLEHNTIWDGGHSQANQVLLVATDTDLAKRLTGTNNWLGTGFLKTPLGGLEKTSFGKAGEKPPPRDARG